jgi:hypothetical protein
MRAQMIRHAIKYTTIATTYPTSPPSFASVKNLVHQRRLLRKAKMARQAGERLSRHQEVLYGSKILARSVPRWARPATTYRPAAAVIARGLLVAGIRFRVPLSRQNLTELQSVGHSIPARPRYLHVAVEALSPPTNKLVYPAPRQREGSGFAVPLTSFTPAEELIWWRRRESNPRPTTEANASYVRNIRELNQP